MFCQKCGNEVREGAVFCLKCGTKLIKEEVAHQTPVDPITASPKPIEQPVQSPPVTPIVTPAQQTAPSPQSSAPSASTGTSEIYKLLKEGVSHCPKVKAVTSVAKGYATIINGAVYNYVVNTLSGQPKLVRTMAKPFMIALAIIGGFMAWVAASIGWDMMDGYGFNKDYTIPLAIGLLAIGLFGVAVTIFGEKESKVVLPDIRKALESRSIKMPSDEQQKKSYIIMLVVYNAVALIGIVVLIFNLVPSGYFGGRRAVDSTAYNYNAPTQSSSPSLPGASSESVSLSGTYTNTEEGFAFKYPSGWTVREDYSTPMLRMIAVLSSVDVDSGYRASISIIKSDIDDTFSATISEIHESYSLTIENQKNLKIISLSDITLNGYPARKIVFSYDDNRGSYTNIQFFYAVNYTMYLVHCTSLQSYFDKNEPIFNAIMDTYTITNSVDIYKRDSYINYPDEVVYNGTSIGQLITNWTIDAVTAWLGKPSYDDYYAGGRYFNFNNNISFFFDQDTRKINIIMVTPTAVMVDGVTLDKNREGLINILGVPGYENAGYNEMEGTNFYFMQYFFADYNYYIDMPDRNSKADSITFYNNLFYDGGLDTITQQNQNTFQATHIVVTNDGTNLRLRDAPGFNATQIGSLEYGSSVRVLEFGVSAVDDAGNRGNWTYVITENGRTGWCFGAYLQPLP